MQEPKKQKGDKKVVKTYCIPARKQSAMHEGFVSKEDKEEYKRVLEYTESYMESLVKSCTHCMNENCGGCEEWKAIDNMLKVQSSHKVNIATEEVNDESAVSSIEASSVSERGKDSSDVKMTKKQQALLRKSFEDSETNKEVKKAELELQQKTPEVKKEETSSEVISSTDDLEKVDSSKMPDSLTYGVGKSDSSEVSERAKDYSDKKTKQGNMQKRIF